jgi:hypothetical protein
VDRKYRKIQENSETYNTMIISNLPRYHIYLRLMIDGIAGDAFSSTTMPPEDLSHTEMNTKKIIRVSRERFATRQSIVEEKINKCINSQNQ